MELFSTLLCMLSMFAGVFFVITLVVRRIRRKPKKKIYSRGLLISVIVFIASIALFAVFQTPESKAEYEQQRIEKQKENEAKKQAEKEAEEEKAKKQSEQEAKEQAEKEAKEKAEQEAKEQAEQEAKEQAEKEAEKASAEAQKQAEKKADDEAEKQEAKLRKAIVEVVGEDNLDTFYYFDGLIKVRFKGHDGWNTKSTVEGIYMDMKSILKITQEQDTDVEIYVVLPLTDTYGNISEDNVIQSKFSRETIKKINFDNFDYNNIPTVADEWWNDKVINY